MEFDQNDVINKHKLQTKCQITFINPVNKFESLRNSIKGVSLTNKIKRIKSKIIIRKTQTKRS